MVLGQKLVLFARHSAASIRIMAQFLLPHAG
jgi:hypothetical protein